MDSAISLKQKLTPPLESDSSPSDLSRREIEASSSASGEIAYSSLIESFRNGEENAFKILVETYQWRLYCSALKILKSKEDAEEAVAETFAIAFKERKKFKGNSGIYTYLWRICFNLCYHIRSKKQQRPSIFSIDDKNAEGNDTYTSAQHDFRELYTEGNPRFLHITSDINNLSPHKLILKSAIRSAIARLPIHHSRIIILKDFYNYSYEEIATILSIPRGTVMSRLARAREALKKSLQNIIAPAYK